MASDRAFFYRRLHSLLGVIPVGAFLVEHLITNYFATRGEEAFTEKVLWINNLPFLILLEVFFIFLPILFHGVYGLYIAYQAKPNLGSFGTLRNAMFVLQRVTGVITLIFIAWHVWETRVQVALGNVAKEELYDLMVAILSNNWMFAFYLVGVIAAVFHFANGLWS
ncbi:MAG TPA: succinate dehydrogenase cytochrome b558 subunit, partial [Calditerricola sp.]